MGMLPGNLYVSMTVCKNMFIRGTVRARVWNSCRRGLHVLSSDAMRAKIGSRLGINHDK